MDKNGRQLRIHTPNTIHHVMIRGNNKQQIFFEKNYFEFFLEIVKKSATKFDHKIIAYCLMPNHAHLIVRIYCSSLSQVMQYINFRYARWLNYKRHRIGHLFQGRYRSIEVHNETYLMNLCRYVHFNPIVAKIATNLDQYQWSSHFYFTQNNAPEWMEIKFLLNLIYSKTNQSYFEFINNASEREQWKPTMWITETGKIEYDKDAVQSLQTSTLPLSLIQSFVSPNEVLEKVCFQLGVEKTILLGPSRNRVIAKQRILYAWCLLKYAKLNITDVAELLQRTRSMRRRHLRVIELHSEYYFSQETLQAINQLFI